MTRCEAVNTNNLLIDLYVKNAKSLGTLFEDDPLSMCASTDFGNVSQIKPSIHPLFRIKTEGANHTHEFTKATGCEENQLPTLNSAKSMAMTAVDVVYSPEIITNMKKEFDEFIKITQP